MDLPSVRGTSLTLNQRHNRPASQQIRFHRRPLPRSYPASHKNSLAPTTSKISAQTQSSTRPLTWPELTRSLEAWKDPESDAQEDKAKDRITDCFRRFSDSLDLSSLSLSTLPDVVGRMQHVQYLSIADNRFSDIPVPLVHLASLKLLNVSDNILTAISDIIKEFEKLEILNAECNQLAKVSEHLARLPKIRTVLLSHNRILEFPSNIHRIEELQLEDQCPPAVFADFSPEFAVQWVNVFQNEPGSGHLEMWLARYQEILRLAETVRYREAFRNRIGRLLDTMVNNRSLRTLCYDKARGVLETCHDGILFSLFEMEIKQVEEKMIALQLSDEEVFQEIERTFNFYRLQELALLHAERESQGAPPSTEDTEIDVLETVLFFYASPANTLDMPLGGERLHFMRYPDTARATHDDVAAAVARIRREKSELGQYVLVEFISDKEFWVSYLESRYTDIIAEHRQIFMNQMETLEDEKDQMSEYDYLTQANGIAEEKRESERRLYHQLTKNIVGG